ncbi:hypothetical protein IKE82_01820 [Candidatus Saccharibacteria bacterium]|nr:hypothetical protein [Candidatus Saccharibacteria bacterium]
MNKKTKQYWLWIGLGLVLVAIVLIVTAIVNAMRGKETGNVTIGGEAKVTGLVCKDATSVHPALASKPIDSYTNTVTANFQNEKLSSISLLYEGEYGTAARAEEAKSFAMADYNLTLTNEYGESDDIFSVHFSTDGSNMQMVQTARDINKINLKTVTYFLLDKGTNIAKSLDGLKKQYEAKGFTCEISE